MKPLATLNVETVRTMSATSTPAPATRNEIFKQQLPGPFQRKYNWIQLDRIGMEDMIADAKHNQKKDVFANMIFGGFIYCYTIGRTKTVNIALGFGQAPELVVEQGLNPCRSAMD